MEEGAAQGKEYAKLMQCNNSSGISSSQISAPTTIPSSSQSVKPSKIEEIAKYNISNESSSEKYDREEITEQTTSPASSPSSNTLQGQVCKENKIPKSHDSLSSKTQSVVNAEVKEKAVKREEYVKQMTCKRSHESDSESTEAMSDQTTNPESCQSSITLRDSDENSHQVLLCDGIHLKNQSKPNEMPKCRDSVASKREDRTNVKMEEGAAQGKEYAKLIQCNNSEETSSGISSSTGISSSQISAPTTIQSSSQSVINLNDSLTECKQTCADERYQICSGNKLHLKPMIPKYSKTKQPIVAVGPTIQKEIARKEYVKEGIYFVEEIKSHESGNSLDQYFNSKIFMNNEAGTYNHKVPLHHRKNNKIEMKKRMSVPFHENIDDQNLKQVIDFNCSYRTDSKDDTMNGSNEPNHRKPGLDQDFVSKKHGQSKSTAHSEIGSSILTASAHVTFSNEVIITFSSGTSNEGLSEDSSQPIDSMYSQDDNSGEEHSSEEDSVVDKYRIPGGLESEEQEQEQEQEQQQQQQQQQQHQQEQEEKNEKEEEYYNHEEEKEEYYYDNDYAYENKNDYTLQSMDNGELAKDTSFVLTHEHIYNIDIKDDGIELSLLSTPDLDDKYQSINDIYNEIHQREKDYVHFDGYEEKSGSFVSEPDLEPEQYHYVDDRYRWKNPRPVEMVNVKPKSVRKLDEDDHRHLGNSYCLNGLSLNFWSPVRYMYRKKPRRNALGIDEIIIKIDDN